MAGIRDRLQAGADVLAAHFDRGHLTGDVVARGGWVDTFRVVDLPTPTRALLEVTFRVAVDGTRYSAVVDLADRLGPCLRALVDAGWSDVTAAPDLAAADADVAVYAITARTYTETS